MEYLREELDLTGSLGLDFVNTMIPYRTGPVDLLGHPDALIWWLEQSAPGPVRALAPSDLPGLRLLTLEARRLRKALVATLEAVAAGAASVPAPAAATVNRALGVAPAVHRLTGFELDVYFARTHPLALLTPIALSALDLALTTRPDRLRACAADDCLRWFVDTSKGGRRRWCSMERCGNRAKAFRYRSRHT